MNYSIQCITTDWSNFGQDFQLHAGSHARISLGLSAAVPVCVAGIEPSAQGHCRWMWLQLCCTSWLLGQFTNVTPISACDSGCTCVVPAGSSGSSPMQHQCPQAPVLALRSVSGCLVKHNFPFKWTGAGRNYCLFYISVSFNILCFECMNALLSRLKCRNRFLNRYFWTWEWVASTV